MKASNTVLNGGLGRRADKVTRHEPTQPVNGIEMLKQGYPCDYGGRVAALWRER